MWIYNLPWGQKYAQRYGVYKSNVAYQTIDYYYQYNSITESAVFQYENNEFEIVHCFCHRHTSYAC